MKAGIIAAGEGNRLRAEGIQLPKPLVSVDGVPLIERLLRSYERCGISEVICIINEYSLEIKRFVEAKNFRIPVKFVVKTTPSSMHSLFALAPHLGAEDPFLLSTVDSIFNEPDLKAFLRHSEGRSEADGILAITDFIDDENPLYVQFDSSGRISSFSKPEDRGWVTGGLYIFSPRIFNEINEILNLRIERLRNFLVYLLKKGYILETFPFAKIVDVDHVQDIRTAEDLLRGH